MNIISLERPASLVETVCQQLAKLIRGKHSEDVDDRWLPGERSLAEKLGVSRSVVREATKRLEQQGMLEIQHGNGIKIVDRLHRPLSDSLSLLIPDVAGRLEQLIETRLSIEPDAAAFAAQRATKAHLRELRRIHAELERAPDNETAIQCDLAFHHAIADAKPGTGHGQVGVRRTRRRQAHHEVAPRARSAPVSARAPRPSRSAPARRANARWCPRSARCRARPAGVRPAGT